MASVTVGKDPKRSKWGKSKSKGIVKDKPSKEERRRMRQAAAEKQNDDDSVDLEEAPEDKPQTKKDTEEEEEGVDKLENEEKKETPTASSFTELGIIPELQEACDQLGYEKPTPIQTQSIPAALEGRDVMGFAATGSGKTAAFALPLLQSLYENPSPFFGCVLAPTRELAYQIAEQFNALGGFMGLRTTVIIGGEDMMKQSLSLSKKPHVIVATPGRLLDHLEKTKGFSLRTLKFLILDEADRLLDLDFTEPINRILKIIPQQRRTFLFSATPTKKVEQLQRASLANPVRISVSSRITTVETLKENMVITPHKLKDATLVYILSELAAGKSVIVFVQTKEEGVRLPLVLDSLGLLSIAINGDLNQSERLGALNKFRAGARKILVATNIAARGLDIPSVDMVINYSVPDNKDDYIHRVGRTARAGKAGRAITLVCQYDVPIYLQIERDVHGDKKIEELQIDKQEVALLQSSVDQAQREAKIRMKDMKDRKRGGKKSFKKKKDDLDMDD
ncbi:hypothetical protein TRICI_000849 [Trichomonascus ciferrii]|uniref:ATP-dependent rRNA helicase RRP3 n=1 Tax=Trichomonascus ciferrii TaxID=44093 RepID=A0A642VBA6_9ASCO|nr:hypothetical protein TRICI_000849 [Trichomonascus ciferrii]